MLRVEGDPPRMCASCLQKSIEPEFDHGEDRHETEWAWSGNMAVRRTSFDLAGVFDDSLGTGDEFEWEKRLKAAGGRISYCHDALIWHRRTQKGIAAASV